MSSNVKKIVVPIDFSEVSENALNYSIELGKALNVESITLVHIVKNKNAEIEAEQKLIQVLNGVDNNGTINLDSHVYIGDVFDDMGNIAESMNADFIIMGTHGEHGMQKMFGSHALKLITHSKVPFIVVQKDTVYKPINKIAMTIDLEKESIQIVKVAASLSESFNAEVVMIGGDHTDTDLRRKVILNVKTANSHLQQHGIKSSVELLERKDFEKNLINYCKDNDVSMLAATYYPDTFHAFSTKFVQHLLENDLQIPVITLDSVATSSGSQFGFMSV